MGITPSCCVLCLHRNVAALRSKLLISAAVLAFVVAVRARQTLQVFWQLSPGFLQQIGKLLLPKVHLTETGKCITVRVRVASLALSNPVNLQVFLGSENNNCLSQIYKWLIDSWQVWSIFNAILMPKRAHTLM